MTGRRDVEGFEVLLWKWFDAESTVRAFREGNTPDWKAEGTKEAEEAAEHALAAVFKAFESESKRLALALVLNQRMPDHGRDLTPAELKACGFQPQNSRDSDFP